LAVKLFECQRESLKICQLKTLLTCLLLSCSILLKAEDWQNPPEVFNANLDSTQTNVVANSQGNAIASWVRFNTGDFVTSYFSNNAWGPFIILNAATGPTSSSESTAIDDSGTALAIWSDFSNIRTSLFNGTTWNEILPPLFNGFAGNAKIAMDGNGNGAALFASGGSIFASFYTAGVWSTAIPIGIGGTLTDLAYSSNGTAAAVWINGTTVTGANYIGGVWQPTVSWLIQFYIPA
jgi:hypothetical protein